MHLPWMGHLAVTLAPSVGFGPYPALLLMAAMVGFSLAVVCGLGTTQLARRTDVPRRLLDSRRVPSRGGPMSTAEPVRVALVVASPVPYHVPVYRALATHEDVELRVFFGSNEGVRSYTAGFGDESAVSWGRDLVEGYAYEWLPGAAQAEVQGGFLGLRGTGLERRLDVFAPHAIWVHGYSYLLTVRAIAHALRRGIPVLVREEQTLLIPRRGPRSLMRALVLRSLLRRVWALAIGANSRAFFLHYGVPAERLGQANYFSALPLVARAPTPPTRLRVLFVGKLTEKKAPQGLVEAFAVALADPDGIPSTLTIVGDGPLREPLERRVHELGIADDVAFEGFVGRDELPAVLARHDVFCLPSVGHETWGVVVAEAMAAGLVPVVSTRVGAAADLVRDGWNGHQFRSGDTMELAHALRDLARDPARVAEMALRSRALVDGWNVDTAAEGVAALLRRMVGGR